MLARLLACPACMRHIRSNEAHCPFCRRGLPDDFGNAPVLLPPPATTSRFDRCFNRRSGAALAGIAGVAALAAAVCNCGGAYGTFPACPEGGCFFDTDAQSRVDTGFDSSSDAGSDVARDSKNAER